MATGLALSGLAIFFAIIPLSYIVLSVFMAIFGLGLAAVTIAIYALAADLSRPAAYGTVFGILFAMMKAGGSAASLARPSSGDNANQFSIVFVIIGLALSLLSIFFFFLWRKLPATHPG
jgi:hypothetical protein